MRRLFVIVVATLAALAIWTGVFLAGTLEGWWRRPLAPPGNVDDLTVLMEARRTLTRLGAGALAILVAAGFLGWRFRRPAHAPGASGRRTT